VDALVVHKQSASGSLFAATPCITPNARQIPTFSVVPLQY
jgi:hypothetical protein